MKDKFETFRASEKERQALKTLARKANMSKSDFIRHAIFNKEIVVIDGLHELTRELKAIGNNLNQLTVRANMGQLRAVDLSETKNALGGIFDRLTVLCSGAELPPPPELKPPPPELKPPPPPPELQPPLLPPPLLQPPPPPPI